MTRQDLIHKWAVYALALLPVWLLDSCILPRFPLFGITPMLLPLALTAVAVLEGSGAGGGFGLAVGLVWTLSYPLGWGGAVIGMTLAGAAIGSVSQYVLSQSLPGGMLCGAGLLAVLDGLRIAGALISDRGDLPALLEVAVPECLLSLAWMPLIYLLFRAVYRKVGRDKLA